MFSILLLKRKLTFLGDMWPLNNVYLKSPVLGFEKIAHQS